MVTYVRDELSQCFAQSFHVKGLVETESLDVWCTPMKRLHGKWKRCTWTAGSIL